MNKPQKPDKPIDPEKALETIGKVMTLVDMPVKEFKRKEYEVLLGVIKDRKERLEG
jgi:hypothetical protein